MLDESMYPFSLLLSFLAIIVAASLFSRVATAVTVGISGLVLAYFVVPPVFSFRMESRALGFFLLYCTAALIGCVTVQVRRRKHKASLAAEIPELFDRSPNLVLACNPDCSLLETNEAVRAFAAKRSGHLRGFLWLSLVAAADRPRVISAIRHGRNGDFPFYLIDGLGVAHAFHLSVRSRLRTAPNLSLGVRRTTILIFTEINH